MKRIVFLMTLLMLGSEAAAKCSYSGTTTTQSITLSNLKIGFVE